MKKIYKSQGRLNLSFLIIFSFLTISACSHLTNRKVTVLPSNNAIGLDSSQVNAVYERAQFFQNGTQMSICIIQGDSEIYAGIERRNDSLIYIENRDSVFEIGSITKTFTGTILAGLVYEGKIQPDDPVAKYLPVTMHQGSLNGKEPTLAELANHTSGLPFEPSNIRNEKGQYPDPVTPYQSYSVEKLYEYLKTDEVLISTPGEKRLYSNLGAGLLGHILTLATNKSYEQLLKESICTLLKMQNTFVDNDCGALTGCGGIKSSVSDLVKYIRKNMTDSTYFLLAQQPTVKFTENFSGALGWAPYSEKGRVHQGAYGATPGYTCGLIFERNMCLAVIVLSNVPPSTKPNENYIESLCRALYDPLWNTNPKMEFSH